MIRIIPNLLANFVNISSLVRSTAESDLQICQEHLQPGLVHKK